jgi:hypothetical protein
MFWHSDALQGPAAWPCCSAARPGSRAVAEPTVASVRRFDPKRFDPDSTNLALSKIKPNRQYGLHWSLAE